MPFKGFLGPSWEPVALTRILRHYPLQYSTLFMNIQAVIHKERRQRRKTEVFFFHMGAKSPRSFELPQIVRAAQKAPLAGKY